MYGAMRVPCIYTIVMNKSGKELFFGYLPPHGRRLAISEQLAVPGSLVSTLGGRFYSRRRDWNAFEGDLHSGALAIISTPEVILFDPTAEDSKSLRLDSGVLGVVDPCFGPESGIASLTSAT